MKAAEKASEDTAAVAKEATHAKIANAKVAKRLEKEIAAQETEAKKEHDEADKFKEALIAPLFF